MGSTKDLQYKRLNELIFDEEQIVTSLFIVKELKISGCDVQKLLSDYVNMIQQQESEHLQVTYLLSGALKNGKGVAIYLVRDDDLKDHKCRFDNISTEIIYSIQKGKLNNFNVIASINSIYEDGTDFLVNKNCVKRDIKSKKPPVLQSSTTSKQIVAPKKSESGSSNKSEKSVQENGKNHTQSPQKQLKPKNGGIASFFAKAPAKTQNNTNVERVVKDEAPKQSVDRDVKQDIKKDQQNVPKVSVSDEKMEMDDQKDEKPTALKKVDKHVSKKRKKESKNYGPNKKRKRIQEICDSDSSDIFDDEENEDIIEMSDEEPVHVPAVNPLPIPKNKRRKAVDKTYVDEEGFIVTSTEYIYESASEDEEKNTSKPKPEVKVLPQKKNEKANSDTKVLGNKGKLNKKQTSTKQPTLMSFFKKT